MGNAATKRSRKARTRIKPTTGQVVHPEPEVDDVAQALSKLDISKMLFGGFGRRSRRGTFQAAQPGERALRRALVLAERRAAKERAFANGKRRG